jgi:hypothetical protein
MGKAESKTTLIEQQHIRCGNLKDSLHLQTVFPEAGCPKSIFQDCFQAAVQGNDLINQIFPKPQSINALFEPKTVKSLSDDKIHGNSPLEFYDKARENPGF